MTTDLTVSAFGESLTGFEEIAIAKRFGNFTELVGTMASRSLVFTDIVRSGVGVDDAYKAAMDMPLGGLNKYFAEDDEITPDEPTTESGKEPEFLDEEPTT